MEQHIKRGAKVTRWCPVERRAAGAASVAFRAGRTADTRRSIEAALASVPAEVRALTAGPSRLAPRAVPFAYRDFDAARAATLAAAQAPPAPYAVAEPAPIYRFDPARVAYRRAA